jgi:hypothetical protein
LTPPFSQFEDKPRPPLPTPYDAFTPCDVLASIVHDFAADGTSASRGGPVRIDQAHAWTVDGKTLLAVVYYVGADADESFICGGCRVTPHVAVVERKGSGLSLVADGPDPSGMGQEKNDDVDTAIRFRPARAPRTTSC